MAARSKASVGGRSLAGMTGLNPAGAMDISLVNAVCCQTDRSLRRADHSFRGVLPGAVCLSVIVKP